MASSDAAVIVALATHPAQRAWLNHRHNRGGDERGDQGREAPVGPKH